MLKALPVQHVKKCSRLDTYRLNSLIIQKASGWGAKVDENRVREIEEKIAELKARWPAHSVPPSMWMELEKLEEELEEAQKE
jgi:hypothetical protein